MTTAYARHHESSRLPLAGTTRRRAVLRNAHECRRPTVIAQHERAENLLRSGVAEERAKAAASLGQLRNIGSYMPLLHALARESRPGHENREVVSSILEAMDKIGSRHSGQPPIREGREPLRKFIMAHLADPGIVKIALEAMGWTGTREQSIHDPDEIRNEARRAGYEATARVAGDIHFERLFSD